MHLYNESTGKQLHVGDIVETFRKERCILKGMTEPHKPSSTGRVLVEIDGGLAEFYPSVINAKFK